MKTNKNTFFKILSAIVIFLALTFSTNINATTSTSLNTTSTSLNIASSNFAAISGSWWWPKKKRCRVCRLWRCKRTKKCNKGGGTDSIPLDGGLGILVLGAAAFGIKKLRGNNKNDKK